MRHSASATKWQLFLLLLVVKQEWSKGQRHGNVTTSNAKWPPRFSRRLLFFWKDTVAYREPSKRRKKKRSSNLSVMVAEQGIVSTIRSTTTDGWYSQSVVCTRRHEMTQESTMYHVCSSTMTLLLVQGDSFTTAWVSLVYHTLYLHLASLEPKRHWRCIGSQNMRMNTRLDSA